VTEIAPPASRTRIRWEIAIVLALSLGQSAAYSITAIINRSTREQALADQTATLNPSLSDRSIFDLIYQMLAISFDLVPVILVCFLLWSTSRPHLGRLGIEINRPGHDVLIGMGLALLIAAPGIGAYLGGRALGIGVAVDPAGLDAQWWTVPVLLLSALRASLLEEVIALGYLFARLTELGWSRWTIIVASALLRGSYHLYQGFGAFVANVAMGMLFGWLYSRTHRVAPFVVAHFALDAAVFVGYPWAAAGLPDLFGLPG
jgi:membrane protease YdiL (CAAX protease family)